MVKEFDKLESLIKQSMDESTEFMKGFTQLILSKNFEPAIQFQEIAKVRGEQIKASSKTLLNLMRAELNEI
jgi:predicted metal-binding protein